MVFQIVYLKDPVVIEVYFKFILIFLGQQEKIKFLYMYMFIC